MKLGKKDGSKNWLTKKREGRIFSTSEYILNNPEALYILFTMSHVFAVIFFFVLGVLFLVFNMYVLGFVFAVFFGLSLQKFIKFWKFRKSAKEITKNMTVKDILSKK